MKDKHTKEIIKLRIKIVADIVVINSAVVFLIICIILFIKSFNLIYANTVFKCKECAYEFSYNEQYCPFDGKSLEESYTENIKRICGNCGKKLGTQSFCTNCGSKYTGTDTLSWKEYCDKNNIKDFKEYKKVTSSFTGFFYIIKIVVSIVIGIIAFCFLDDNIYFLNYEHKQRKSELLEEEKKYDDI